MLKFCSTCDRESECRVEERQETYTVRDEEITIRASVAVCTICGTELYDLELDDGNLGRAYDVYRHSHQFLSPAEIKAVREKYHLSQRAMSRVLGWGEITLHRYETGALPDRVHNDLLRLLADPYAMREYLLYRQVQLSEKDRMRLEQSLNSLTEESATSALERNFERVHLVDADSAYSGYRKFDVEKLKNMVIFFADSMSGILKTKLMKVLWYSDAIAYKDLSSSISGVVYEKAPYGPVPKWRDVMLQIFIEHGAVEVLEDDASLSYRGITVCAKQRCDTSLFTPAELGIMKSVAAFFDSKSSGESSAISHRERACIDAPDWGKIDYRLANDLNLSL